MSESTIIILLFVAGAFLTLAFTPLSIRFGLRFGVMDAPGERKIHTQPIPRFGGTSIYAALVLVAMMAIPFVPRLSDGFAHNADFYVSIAIGATLVFMIGLVDDVRHASVGARLLVQVVAALIVYFLGGVSIDNIGIPFLGLVDVGYLSLPLTICWIVGVTNALNLIDGLDGLAGGVAFIACASVFVVATFSGNFFAMCSLALLAGCCLGFLRYNSHPARIFLGDNGSLLLGFLLACVSIDSALKRSTSFSLIIPMQILALPVFDTLYSMSRRAIAEVRETRRLSPAMLRAMFRADRGHIHHSLLDLGLSQPGTAWALYGLSLTLGVFGALSAFFLHDTTSLVFLILGCFCFVIMRNVQLIRRSREESKENTWPPS